MPERFVVIGGDAAGMSAAAQARRRRDERDLEIVAFERGSYTSYAACGLPYFVADMVPDAQRLIARSPEQHRERGVDVRTGHEAVAIDVERRVVRVRCLDDGTETDEPYDRLLIATGASPIRPELPGADAAGIFGIQTITDGIALRAAIDDHDPRHAVVVGCGYIGLEMAEAMTKRGLEVSLIEAGPQPMSTLDPDMGALVADALRDLGVSLHLGTAAEGFLVEGGRVRAVATREREFPADIVVLGIGVTPNVDLAYHAGIGIGSTGAIQTDQRMQTTIDGVYAAGDCAESFHRVSRRPAFVALGTHANKQGRVVGVNASGGYATFPGVVGTAITKVCDYEVGRTGLNESEARRAGFAYDVARIEARTRAHYYPGASKVTVKMLAEQRTGRLLGAQIIGKEGAAKRIDVVAAAVWNGMTASEFANLDLGYAPPFSPVWDPVLTAARKVSGAGD
ncbi:MAG TPA: FAD-dependent oxidoreductase [Acidimicrobiia bacterium]|nr:FAD-dependent oxidoreductase [Acidimicrobiia bacterium]